jgi:lipopolysaccharide/colanic/teichoic acid biosynthesis glycosyltransferase
MKNRHALQPNEGFRRRPDKRLLDLVLLLMILPLAGPLFLLLAPAVYCMLGSPILFRHQRPGLYGTPFTLMKFRTMTNARDEAGQLLQDSQRLTRFGRFLRSTSLDELPELLNVLRGEMSLVGPRPLLMEYLEHYTPELQRRHHVLPGITGWAQVNGRNVTTWERRFALDLWYVDHQSLGLDLQILLLTPWKVIKREGVMLPGHEGNFKEFSSKRHLQ